MSKAKKTPKPVPVDNRQTELTETALSWPDKARSIVIDCDHAYEEGAEYLKGIKALLRESKDVFGPIVKAAHLAHKEAKAGQNKVENPLLEAERIIKFSMGSFVREQEALRLKEKRRLEEIARKEAEELRLAEAVALEESGQTEAAEKVIDEPVSPAPVVSIPTTTPKVEGISKKELWHAEVESLVELIQFVAANPAFAFLLKADEPALNDLARKQKADLNIPGVKAVSEISIASR